MRAAARLPFQAGSPAPFASYSIGGLRCLYEAFSAAHDALQGVYNQPRSGTHRVTEAIETEIERCADAMQAIAREIEGREPTTEDEQSWRGETLIFWGIACGSWRDVGKAFVETTADLREAA